MIIQYYGHSCFKITTKPAGRGQEDIVVFIDPFEKSIGLRPPQGQADLILVTHEHHDHNNVEALKGNPVIINIPGEYAVKGVNIVGLSSSHGQIKEPVPNTAYIIESEELKICHLGDLGEELSEKQLEEIDGVDVLMIPVGGKYTLNGEDAVNLVKKIEPKIIIPIHYKINGSTIDIEDEKKFCAEMGNCPKEKVSKLNIKKKELEGKSMETVVMSVE